MNKCPVCKTGKMKLSGCYTYCYSCSYSHFIMTNDYLDASAMFLGQLVSNAYFSDRKALGKFMLELIEQHLPMLEQHLRSIATGQANFLAGIMTTVEDHAINLQIGPDKFNVEEAEDGLKCQCGATEFTMVTPGHLVCECSAQFKYNEDKGIFLPTFQCGVCNNITFDSIDSVLIECRECKAAHRYVNGESVLL